LGISTLHEAICSGDNSKVEDMLELPFMDVDTVCHKRTPLQAAIMSKNECTALLLIESGARLDFHNQATIDHPRIIMNIEIKVCRRQIQQIGASSDNNAMEQRRDQIKAANSRIRELQAKCDEIDDKSRINALYAASLYGLTKVVNALVEKGLDMNTPSPKGEYPIVLAVRGGHIDTVSYLLGNGAGIDKFEIFPVDSNDGLRSSNPFTTAWIHKEYAIFLLLLDAALAEKCRQEDIEADTLLLPLDGTDPEKRLAQRLEMWLRLEDSLLVEPSAEDVDPYTAVFHATELVFGFRDQVRGNRTIVEHLIQARVPLHEEFHFFINKYWDSISQNPGDLSGQLLRQPTILEIIFVSLPLVKDIGTDGFWLLRVLQAVDKSRQPFTFENVVRELGVYRLFFQDTVMSEVDA
ncbi:hypothetical protein ACHAPU_010895, partial [Fusarium lateritium]